MGKCNIIYGMLTKTVEEEAGTSNGAKVKTTKEHLDESIADGWKITGKCRATLVANYIILMKKEVENGKMLVKFIKNDQNLELNSKCKYDNVLLIRKNEKLTDDEKVGVTDENELSEKEKLKNDEIWGRLIKGGEVDVIEKEVQGSNSEIVKKKCLYGVSLLNGGEPVDLNDMHNTGNLNYKVAEPIQDICGMFRVKDGVITATNEYSIEAKWDARSIQDKLKYWEITPEEQVTMKEFLSAESIINEYYAMWKYALYMKVYQNQCDLREQEKGTPAKELFLKKLSGEEGGKRLLEACDKLRELSAEIANKYTDLENQVKGLFTGEWGKCGLLEDKLLNKYNEGSFGWEEYPNVEDRLTNLNSNVKMLVRTALSARKAGCSIDISGCSQVGLRPGPKGTNKIVLAFKAANIEVERWFDLENMTPENVVRIYRYDKYGNLAEGAHYEVGKEVRVFPYKHSDAVCFFDKRTNGIPDVFCSNMNSYEKPKWFPDLEKNNIDALIDKKKNNKNQGLDKIPRTGIPISGELIGKEKLITAVQEGEKVCKESFAKEGVYLPQQEGMTVKKIERIKKPKKEIPRQPVMVGNVIQGDVNSCSYGTEVMSKGRKYYQPSYSLKNNKRRGNTVVIRYH